MVISFLLGSIISAISIVSPAIDSIAKQVQRDMEISIAPPPAADNKDSAYCYNGMIKIVFSKDSKIEAIIPSDGSDQWLSTEIRKMIKNKRFKITELERLAKKYKVNDRCLIFPVIVASSGYSNLLVKQKPPSLDFYKFDKQNIEGDVIFGNVIEIVHFYNWHHKSKSAP